RNTKASRILLAQVMQPRLQIVPPGIKRQQRRQPQQHDADPSDHRDEGIAGTLTRNSARYSRKPETRISRQRMTIAANNDQPWMVSSAASIKRQDDTRSLSAIGSSMRPSEDCWAQMRAKYPSRKSVMAAAIKNASATQRSHSPPPRMLCQNMQPTTIGTA